MSNILQIYFSLMQYGVHASGGRVRRDVHPRVETQPTDLERAADRREQQDGIVGVRSSQGDPQRLFPAVGQFQF